MFPRFSIPEASGKLGGGQCLLPSLPDLRECFNLPGIFPIFTGTPLTSMIKYACSPQQRLTVIAPTALLLWLFQIAIITKVQLVMQTSHVLSKYRSFMKNLKIDSLMKVLS